MPTHDPKLMMNGLRAIAHELDMRGQFGSKTMLIQAADTIEELSSQFDVSMADQVKSIQCLADQEFDQIKSIAKSVYGSAAYTPAIDGLFDRTMETSRKLRKAIRALKGEE